jgi:hypothetical protein
MPLRSSMYQHPIKPLLFRVRVPHANTSKGKKGRRVCHVPSGAIPRRMNGNASLAPAQMKRKSHGSWRPVTPTPAACPFTAEMVIFRQRKMASVTFPPGSLCAE